MENNNTNVNMGNNEGNFVCSYCGKHHNTIEEMAKCILDCSNEIKLRNKENARKLAEEKIKKTNDNKSHVFNEIIDNIISNINNTNETINSYLDDSFFSYSLDSNELSTKLVHLRQACERLYNNIGKIRNNENCILPHIL